MALVLLLAAAAAARLGPPEHSDLVASELFAEPSSRTLLQTQAPHWIRDLEELAGSGAEGSGPSSGEYIDDDGDSDKTGTIVGIALGAAAGSCMLLAAVFYLFVIKPRSDTPPNPYQDAESQELPPIPSSAASPTYGGAYDRACGGGTDTRATPPQPGPYGGPPYSGGSPGVTPGAPGSGGPAYGAAYGGAPTPPGVPASRV